MNKPTAATPRDYQKQATDICRGSATHEHQPPHNPVIALGSFDRIRPTSLGQPEGRTGRRMDLPHFAVVRGLSLPTHCPVIPTFIDIDTIISGMCAAYTGFFEEKLELLGTFRRLQALDSFQADAPQLKKFKPKK